MITIEQLVSVFDLEGCIFALSGFSLGLCLQVSLCAASTFSRRSAEKLVYWNTEEQRVCSVCFLSVFCSTLTYRRISISPQHCKSTNSSTACLLLTAHTRCQKNLISTLLDSSTSAPDTEHLRAFSIETLISHHLNLCKDIFRLHSYYFYEACCCTLTEEISFSDFACSPWSVMRCH